MPKLANRLSNKFCPEGMSVEEWQIALRCEQAYESDFEVTHLDDNRLWGDYLVSSLGQGGRYKVAFRGVCSERNYCSCLDFRTNGLGTCKHLEAVCLHLREEVEGYPWTNISYQPSYSSVFVSYKGGRSIRMRIGLEQAEQYLQLQQRYFDSNGVLPPSRYHELEVLEREGHAIAGGFRLYEDVYDFASAEIARMEWQERIDRAYPEKRSPWYDKELAEEYKEEEHTLYKLLRAENALIVAPRTALSVALAQRLLLRIAEHGGRSSTSYIIVEKNEDLKDWTSVQAIRHLAVEVMTAEDFIKRSNSIHPSISFVWVDDARGLRDWKNELSLALKKLSISNLYMRLETISDLSPIQLSSTLQHISPFLLGPLYRFVHQYRQDFPLYDDGSNAPSPIVQCTFFLPSLGRDAKDRSTLSSEEKVNHLMRALASVMQDEDARNIFISKIHEQFPH